MMAQQDLTQGAEGRVIVRFALPMMGSMLLQTTYTLVDAMIVGNFVSPTALGAVGVTNAIVWLITLVATGIGTGTSIALSQYVGAQRAAEVKRLLSSALLFALLVGLGLTALSLAAAKPVIWTFLDTPPAMRVDSLRYFCIISSGVIFQMLYNVSYGALRAHGDSKGAILFLLVAALLNLLLDLLFVIIFRWGVPGAALATVISQAGSATAACLYLWRLYPQLRLSRGEWRLEGKMVRIILRLCVPVVLQSSVTAIGFIILQRLVNSFGAPSIEGFTAMQRVESLIHIPSNAFHTAISNFTGQNIGAGQIQRIRRGYRQTLLISVLACVLLVVLVLLLGRQALQLFNIAGEALQRGLEHLYIVAFFIVFSTLNNVTSGLLQGAGDVRLPALASFINLLIRLSSAYLMAPTWIGFRSIYYSLPLAWTTACLIVLLRYRSGKWLQKSILQAE